MEAIGGFSASDNEVDDVDDGPYENEILGMEVARRWGPAMLSDMPGGGTPLTCRWPTYSSVVFADAFLQPGLSVWSRSYAGCIKPLCSRILCRAQQLAAGAL